jgi:hypothetical protein
MKKVILSLLFAVVSMGAFAQFEADTKYVSASLTGFGMSWQDNAGFELGLDATGGYFVADSWMVLGQFGWAHRKHFNEFNLGAGVRYYMQQNGLFFGSLLKYNHVGTQYKNDNFIVAPEVGYCFYLNNHVSIEPAVYIDMCLNHFKDYTKIGLRIGFGYYF